MSIRAVIFLSAVVLAGCAEAPPSAPEPPPNVVVILADDLGYGDLGVTGAPDIETPHLDRIAREGVQFTRAYANAPVCTPTRVALLSGQYQQRTGTDRVIYVNERDQGLDLDVVLLPELLQEAGYATGIFGKWHLGYPKAHFPIHQGFDRFVGFVAGNVDYFAHTDRLGHHDLWRDTTEIFDDRYMTDLATDEALAFIEEVHDEGPFFVYLPYSAPHDPFQGPEHRHTAGDQEMTRQTLRTRAVYRSMVESMDANVGRVLERLEALGLAQHTAVFFMSDNGGLPVVARNAPFRGHKRFLWDGGIHTPLLARWPSHIPAGTTSDALVAGMDLFPTVLDLAGLEPPPGLTVDGQSLRPAWMGAETAGHDTLFFHYDDPRLDPQAAVITADGWKYLRDAEGQEYLFNLATDPAESLDLSEAEGERLARMKQAAAEWLERVRSSAI